MIAGPAEGAALGNIMSQAMAKSKIESLADARKIIRNSFELKEFTPENDAEWNSNYSKFLEICIKLKFN